MTNRLGDIGIIFSLYFLYDFFTFDICVLNNLIINNLVTLFIVFFLLGGLTKRAQFPFRAWLPLAIAAPTPISALVHSSTLVTAGVYLFIRFDLVFKYDYCFILNLLVLTRLTLLVSGLRALREIDIKKVIAFSTLSQLGLMIMILFIGSEILRFFHILTHALFKALLFMCSGVFILENFDNQDIRNYCMTIKTNRLVRFIFFISSLSLVGFPFLRGFYSKDLILEFMYRINYNLFYVSLLIIFTIITSLYSFRLVYFSLIIGKIGGFLVLVKTWDNMYNFFLILFLGTLFSGRGLSWLIIEKLDYFFFKI